MADTPNDNNKSPSTEPSDHGYRPLKHLDGSLFPNNNRDFASSFMQPRGSVSQLYNQSPAAAQPPWEDPDQAWRYVDGRVWTGEAFVVPYHAEPDTRSDVSNIQASEGFPTAPVSQDHRRIPALRGPPDLGGLGSNGSAQDLGVYLDRGADSSFQNLVGASSHGSQTSTAPPRNIVRETTPPTNKGQFVFTGWNDDAKRQLFMWKVKRKKGYAFFLHLFPGETVESLQEAFQQYRDEGERLYNG